MAFIFDTLGQIQRATAMTGSIEVVLQFEWVINAGNAEGICALMSSDGDSSTLWRIACSELKSFALPAKQRFCCGSAAFQPRLR